MTRRKTDGVRIALNAWKRQHVDQDNAWSVELAESVNRIIRRRMAEAWEEGWFDRDCQEADWNENPYGGGGNE